MFCNKIVQFYHKIGCEVSSHSSVLLYHNLLKLNLTVFFNPGRKTRPDGEQFHGDRQFGHLRGRPRRRLRPLRRSPAVGLVRNVRQVEEDANPQSHPQVWGENVQCLGELGSHIQVTKLVMVDANTAKCWSGILSSNI